MKLYEFIVSFQCRPESEILKKPLFVLASDCDHAHRRIDTVLTEQYEDVTHVVLVNTHDIII